MKRLSLLVATAVTSVLSLRVAQASQYRDTPTPVGITVSQPGTAGKVIERCILAAAQAQRLPPAMLVILLNVVGGRLGRVSGNTNATVDIGPMQVNEIWLPDMARHWGVSVPSAFLGLRDDFCANIEAGRGPGFFAAAWTRRVAISGPGLATTTPTIPATKPTTCARCWPRRSAFKPPPAGHPRRPHPSRR